ncbi:MAG TPA: hypothetical protein VM534_09715 [Thermoanaerobaculia bacterium]|nr:hypothetical protein [Thermoanaerobaculia bacterium]
MSSSCEAYRSDPGQWPGHLAGCARCQDLERDLERVDRELHTYGSIPASPDLSASIGSSLPVAPWEGAGHRPWSLIGAGALLILVAAATVFVLLGLSPLQGWTTSLRESLPSGAGLMEIARSLSAILSQAPRAFHLFVAGSFLLVNLLFVVLLRRTPRGYDATR